MCGNTNNTCGGIFGMSDCRRAINLGSRVSAADGEAFGVRKKLMGKA